MFSLPVSCRLRTDPFRYLAVSAACPHILYSSQNAVQSRCPGHFVDQRRCLRRLEGVGLASGPSVHDAKLHSLLRRVRQTTGLLAPVIPLNV